MIVLDTSIVIEIEKGNKGVIDRLEELGRDSEGNLALTSAVYAEVLYGFVAIEKREHGEEFLKTFDVLDFDKKSARAFALLKHALEKKGTIIPLFDIITASIVIAKNATLISSDKHFESIPGLRLVSF